MMGDNYYIETIDKIEDCFKNLKKQVSEKELHPDSHNKIYDEFLFHILVLALQHYIQICITKSTTNFKHFNP